MKNLLEPVKQNRILGVFVASTAILLVLVNVAFYYMCASGSSCANESWWPDIRGNLLNPILINFLAAYIIYVLVVHIPSTRKRDVIRNNLRVQYHDFKKAVISHFLGAVNGASDIALVDRLCDIRKFRDYFKEDESAKWYAITTALPKNTLLMGDILVELALLRTEIAFMLSNVEIHDEQVFAFLKNLSSTVYRMEQGSLEYDDVKSFMSFMWQLFAGWSWVEGYAEGDVVEALLEKI